MNYLAVSLLQAAEVDSIVSELGKRTFADGRLTAAGLEREVKNNLQLPGTGPETDRLLATVASAFGRNGEFQAFALPRRIARPMFSRYDPGMEHGAHIDNAIMGGLRTDSSVTLFLTRPETYDGGELVLDLPLGHQEIKLDAGEAIVYSSSKIHHVAPVTRGARLAAVTWVQSMIRNENLRGILQDLHLALEEAVPQKNCRLSLLVARSYHNLLRHAAES